MLIGLHGRMQSGKDTVYERARRLMRDVIEVERRSFADPLYESAAAALGLQPGHLREWKTDPNIWVDVSYDDGDGTMALKRHTVREYLQAYGTEAHRGVFGTDFWVKAARLDDHAGRVVLVTDVRFENEATAVKAAGGYVVQVVGPDDPEDATYMHASEAGIPEVFIDATIYNTVRDDDFATLDDTVNQVVRLFLRLSDTHVLDKSCWCDPDCEACP